MTVLCRIRRSRWRVVVQSFALAGMILQPVPMARSYWTDSNNDGVKEWVENPPEGDSWWNQDGDGDGWSNFDEAVYGSDPYRLDSDFDGITDKDEHDLLPLNDPWDSDSDDDGFSDFDEYYHAIHGITPAVNYASLMAAGAPYFSTLDADGDGTQNPWDSDPTNNDRDGDGSVNWQDGYMDDYWNGSGDPSMVNTAYTDPGVYHGGTWYPSGTADSDNDGTPDPADPYPWGSHTYNGAEYGGPWSDQDADSVPDSADPFPQGSYIYNGTEYAGTWLDQDGDGIPDPADPYPSQPGSYWYNSAEYGGNWTDSDSDSIPDPADSWPTDSWNGASHYNYNGNEYAGEFTDRDSDSVPDPADSWPDDPENGLDSDADGLDNYSERTQHHTNPLNVDSDDDYLTDSEELLIYHTNPLLQKTGPAQAVNDFYIISAQWLDSDHDGLPDKIEDWYTAAGHGLNKNDPADASGDLDGDGVTNQQAYNFGWNLAANLNQYDQDGDGITDAVEDSWSAIHPGILNKTLFADAVADFDGDEVMNFEEVALGMDPGNPRGTFSPHLWHPETYPPDEYVQHPGVPDFFSWWYLTIWLPAQIAGSQGGYWTPPDTDGSGVPDVLENLSSNPDFATIPSTRAAAADYDADGMPDVWERRHGFKLRDASDAGPAGGILAYGPAPAMRDFMLPYPYPDYPNAYEAWLATNPPEYVVGPDDWLNFTDQAAFAAAQAAYEAAGRIDADHDGLSNRREEALQTHPRITDSDGDGFGDGFEVQKGASPSLRIESPLTQAQQQFTAVQALIGQYQTLVAAYATPAANLLSTWQNLSGQITALQVFLDELAGQAATPASQAALQSLSASNNQTARDLAETDEDKDGLSRETEIEFGSNDTLVDTDGDGVPDPLDGVPYEQRFKHPRVSEKFAIIEIGTPSSGRASQSQLSSDGYCVWYQGSKYRCGRIGGPSFVLPFTEVSDVGQDGWVIGSGGNPATNQPYLSLLGGPGVLLPDTITDASLSSDPVEVRNIGAMFGPGGKVWADLTVAVPVVRNGGNSFDTYPAICQLMGMGDTASWTALSYVKNGEYNSPGGFPQLPDGSTEYWTLGFDLLSATQQAFSYSRHASPNLYLYPLEWVDTHYKLNDVTFRVDLPTDYDEDGNLLAPKRILTALADTQAWRADQLVGTDYTPLEARIYNEQGGPIPVHARWQEEKFLQIGHLNARGMAIGYTYTGYHTTFKKALWLNGRGKILSDWVTEEQRNQYPGLDPIDLNEGGAILASTTSGKLVALLPIDVVQPKLKPTTANGGLSTIGEEVEKDGNENDKMVGVSNIRFCRWADAFPDNATEVDPQFYTKDRDRFQIRIPSIIPGVTKIKIRSRDVGKTVHSGMYWEQSGDGPTTIKLNQIDGALVSDPVLLVADKDDDVEYNGDGEENVADDATLQANFESPIEIEFPELNNVKIEFKAAKPVGQVTLNIAYCSMGDTIPQDKRDLINLQILKAKEVYRQIGVKLVVSSIWPMKLPSDDPNYDFPAYYGLDQVPGGATNPSFSVAETNQLWEYLFWRMNHASPPEQPQAIPAKEIFVAFSDATLHDPDPAGSGRVVNGFVADYMPPAVVSLGNLSRRDHLTLAHEVGHILTRIKGHAAVPFRLMVDGDGSRYEFNQNDSKRLIWDEEDRIKHCPTFYEASH
jgi:hypothetical protein